MAEVNSKSDPDRISVELSARRTGMSFQRTRMSADRTLMSVIRTSLSLISFGFTIYQVFEKLRGGGHAGARGCAAQFRRDAGCARHRDAGSRNCLSHPIHGRATPRARGNAR